MNVCKWCMSGSATENSILLSVLPRLNKIFNQSIKSLYFPHIYIFSQRKKGFQVLLTAVFWGNDFHALEVDKTKYDKDNNK